MQPDPGSPAKERAPASVRVRDDATSTFAGHYLNVVRVALKAKNGVMRTSYLCEMPGYPNPGWFLDEEVERGR